MTTGVDTRETSVTEISNLNNEWADNPYKLNVVYFVPNDNDSLANYRQRISRILLDAQTFFGDNLEREGFGRKSFGLDLLNDSLINVVTVFGQYNAATYPYSGGAAAVQQEVDAYFAANPTRKTSDHYLIILPSRSGDPLNPGGVPFYGTGRYCYALDYPSMEARYLGAGGTLGNLATVWIGGMIHELGHGLNGPHNYGTVSATAAHGTALMGAGNSTYGRAATFITQTSAAIFSNSQTFSAVTRSDWSQSFNFSLGSLQSSLVDGKIILSGRFTSQQPINYVAAYFDREPYGGNLDYDAISFGAASINNDSLYIECPLSDFQNRSGNYQLRIHFLAANGVRTTEYFTLSFAGEVPNLSAVFRAPLSNRQLWTVTSSGDQPGSPVSNILDGNLSTNWHTPWSPATTPHPHAFTINMKSQKSFNTLVVFNRSNLNGALQSFYLKTSDDGSSWHTVGTYNLARNAGANYVNLGGTQAARYIRLESISSHGNFNYTHMAEFDVLLR
ncbi:discoidin domain-containing protein [Sphingobacterium oryzagri]|uniref:Discoidin domain-containing protein n=1 Tax=Sphingobacterium oryzagri TaxID=3025669 RepID=A0ABY7WEU3_9SPHI|nr:discoidin domain-containing protein [Sphingobacterium sp. KACC 22765]WDF68149.1 discoidin domain-containing protein [Sphingobacterium sp. KACC 22765]